MIVDRISVDPSSEFSMRDIQRDSKYLDEGNSRAKKKIREDVASGGEEHENWESLSRRQGKWNREARQGWNEGLELFVQSLSNLRHLGATLQTAG